jgi:hypothetical protein
MMLSKFIYVVAHISSAFLLMAKKYSIAHCTYFIYPFILYEHPGCFYFLVIMNNASNNIVGEKGKFLPFFGGHRVGKEV